MIVRNVNFVDARDCFPAWSPTDGDAGNWNSQYDLMSVRRSENVWVDHNTFSDGDNPDSDQPVYFGRPVPGARRRAATSPTRPAWSPCPSTAFTDHDKMMLIGSSNTVGPDVGRLNVTLHHNLFDGTSQRAAAGALRPGRRLQQPLPDRRRRLLVRLGRRRPVGHLRGEQLPRRSTTASPPTDVIFDWGGTMITEKGTWVRAGSARPGPVNLLDGVQRQPRPGPRRRRRLDADPARRPGRCPATLVPLVVDTLAGANRLPV